MNRHHFSAILLHTLIPLPRTSAEERQQEIEWFPTFISPYSKNSYHIVGPYQSKSVSLPNVLMRISNRLLSRDELNRRVSHGGTDLDTFIAVLEMMNKPPLSTWQNPKSSENEKRRLSNN